MSRHATPADVLEGRARWCVVRGDSMRAIEALPVASIDAVITDPPYSSGGMFRGDRARSTDQKYTRTEARGARPDFAGDVRDQRSFALWWTLWGSLARERARRGAMIAAFSDWRQCGATQDAIQCAGWILRGLAVWDKGAGARPAPGGFRQQAEFVHWGSLGPLPPCVTGVTVLPGVIPATVRADDKHHQTGKPTDLMRPIARLAPPGGVILDPFAGSGTTGVGAILEGRRAILIEIVDEIADVAVARCEAAEASTRAP
jgi:site-specific DNA-methyltransferase (adenine-specific)